MGEPSQYELAAWDAIQQFSGRPLSQGMRWAGEKVSNRLAALGDRTDQFLEDAPRVKSVVSRGKEVVEKSSQTVGRVFGKAADALPDWSGAAWKSSQQTLARISRVGLSPKRVVSRLQEARPRRDKAG